MKKKIGIIIAILLCVVLIFTFVACKKKKTTTTEDEATIVVTAEEQAAMEARIDSYLETWLLANAQEEDAVTNQKGLLNKALQTQLATFSYTKSDKTPAAPTFNITYKNGVYTIEVVWSKDVKKTYTKQAKTVEYVNWAGKYSKPEDDWLSSKKASTIVDTLVAAGVNTINYVTGNAVTGKFGADGVIGINVAGKDYGLRIKGNVDGTTKENNEIGLVIVDGDLNELGGLYYKAAATAKDSKLYLQYSSTGDDGKLIRENGKIVYNYKYIDYADIYGLISGFLPEEFKPANDGALVFKDEDNEPIIIDGLGSLLSALNAGGAASGVKAGINMLSNAYEHDGRYYLDVNLGYVLSQVSDLMSTLTLDLEFLKDLNIDLANLSGLLGHITLSGKVEEVEVGDEIVERLTDFELAVNIPKCTFYLNGERSTETQKNDKELKFDVPAISFAIYLENFTFLTDKKVENVVPTEAATKAVYFSPTNVDLSGDLYINHYELDENGARTKVLDSTFHYDFMTDINPLEIIENGRNSTAKAALVIKQSKGNTYDPETATNFLTLTYEQADRILCASGTAFKLEDGGNTLYTFSMKDKSFKTDIKNEIMLWLGLDTANKNWHGVSSKFELLDYVLTSNKTFEANKTYYIKNDKGEYVEADVEVGADVPENTYYVVPDTYESAKVVFGNALVKSILSIILGSGENTQQGNNDNGGSTAEASFEIARVGDYFSAFKDLYNEFLDAKKIEYNLDGKFGFKAEVSAEMINDVIDAINETFDAELDPIVDPKNVNVYYNWGTDYKDKLYVMVEYGDNTYELTIDDSTPKTFIIDFKMTKTSGRVYSFNFTAVKGVETESATKWTATVVFDIKAVKDNVDVIENHTQVTLSDFHGKWGQDNSEAIKALLPSEAAKAAASPIFPAEDIPSVGTQIAKGLLSILNNEKVTSAILTILAGFMA